MSVVDVWDVKKVVRLIYKLPDENEFERPAALLFE